MEIHIGDPNMKFSTEERKEKKGVKYLTQTELDSEFPIVDGVRNFLTISAMETVKGKKIITLPDGRKIKIMGSENIKIGETRGVVNISF